MDLILPPAYGRINEWENTVSKGNGNILELGSGDGYTL